MMGKTIPGALDGTIFIGEVPVAYCLLPIVYCLLPLANHLSPTPVAYSYNPLFIALLIPYAYWQLPAYHLSHIACSLLSIKCP